jgi:hypothetical protein
MSSLSSAVQTRRVDPAAIAAALIAVAERSFFAYAEPAAPEHVVSTGGGWYSASVAFDGPFGGYMTVALPVDLARDLCAAFLGIEAADISDEAAVQDLAGEFANMACGTWLTSLREASCFALEHPEVRLADAAPAADVVVAVNDRPVVIQLWLGAGPAEAAHGPADARHYPAGVA